jgi:hypothetical protein
MSIVDEVRSAPPTSIAEPLPTRYVCSVAEPVPWNRLRLETELKVTVPQELVDIWNTAASLRLFQDVDYGQWGLVVMSAEQALQRTKLFAQNYPKHVQRGDLIVGEFLGDSDLVLLRSDPAVQDYGKIIVVQPIYGRGEWPVVAESINAFLKAFLDAQGATFWPNA